MSGDSDIRTISEVDQPGVRIAIAARSAYDLYLSRNLQHAELIRAEGIDGSFDLFVGEGLDALAGLRPRLLSDVVQIENARILDGRFTAVQQAVGTPSDRTAGAAYLLDFVAEAKASGLIIELIARHQVDGLLVAS
ncbi:MAG TPA: hypothetical protein EYO66_05200 [Gammaproteobacteria bacterium]|nr:hypothetical protein [Gammaproteobacteria bacterium]